MGPNSSLQDICYAVSLRTLRADFGITCAVLIYSENTEYEVFPCDIEIPLVCFFFFLCSLKSEEEKLDSESSKEKVEPDLLLPNPKL